MATKRRRKQVKTFEAFGKFLREARIARGLTQREVSQKMKYSSAQFVSNFERGLVVPPAQKLKVLLSLYRISANEMIEKLIVLEKTRLTEVFGSPEPAMATVSSSVPSEAFRDN